MRDLKSAGCGKIFREQVSSVGEREQLDRALDYLRGGDTLVVTKVDRLARSTVGLWDIVKRLEGFVRVTAGRQRVVQHAHPQATFKPRGHATRPMRQSVSACKLGG